MTIWIQIRSLLMLKWKHSNLDPSLRMYVLAATFVVCWYSMQTVWTQVRTNSKSGWHVPYLATYSCKKYLTQSRLATLLSSLIARRWVGLQTLWWFRLKDLSIDEMVGAWCFGCLSGPPGFTCWISFAPVFSLIYCWVLILALSPCYILIYMF